MVDYVMQLTLPISVEDQVRSYFINTFKEINNSFHGQML